MAWWCIFERPWRLPALPAFDETALRRLGRAHSEDFKKSIFYASERWFYFGWRLVFPCSGTLHDSLSGCHPDLGLLFSFRDQQIHRIPIGDTVPFIAIIDIQVLRSQIFLN